MIHFNEYDVCHRMAVLPNRDSLVFKRPGKNWANFEFTLPDEDGFFYGLSVSLCGETQPVSIPAAVNGTRTVFKPGEITPFERFRPLRKGKNSCILELPEDQGAFYYAVLSIHIQYDRKYPELPAGNNKFKVLNLCDGMDYSDYSPVAGCPFFKSPDKTVIETPGAPFVKLPEKCLGHYQEYPVGIKAEKIFFLGCISSYDFGTAMFMTKPVEHRFEQFIGDHIGDIIINYADRGRENIPLIYGVTIWWDVPWFSRFQEPFASNERSHRILQDTLLLRPAVPSLGDSSFYFAYQPKQTRIKSIAVKSTGLRTGYPVISGITFTSSEENEFISPLPMLFRHEYSRISGANGGFFAERRYSDNLEQLKREVYTFKDSLPGKKATITVPDDHREPRVDFSGTPLATMLTNEYYQNVFAAKKLLLPDGSFSVGHRFFAGLPGAYDAIGTWGKKEESFPASHGFEYNYPRDRGSTQMEVARLGIVEGCINSAKNAGEHLYLATPPHWLENRFIAQNRDFFTFETPAGKKFSGLLESNGHNWLLLSYAALWHQYADRNLWYKDFFKTFADALEWDCWLLDNSLDSSQPEDIIPEGGEYAGENNMILYEVKSALAKLGKGKMPPFRYDCACANIFAYYALLKGIEIAGFYGEHKQERRWREYAARLKKAMLKHLVKDSPSGPIWRISMDSLRESLYLSSRLSPLYLWADGFSYSLDGMDRDLLEISLNSYREHRRRFPEYCHCVREVGYGTIYSALGALMADEVKDYSNYVKDAVEHIYFRPRGCLDDNGKVILETSPYVVHMRRGVHESGKFWKTFGIPANVIHVTALLKMVRLIKGIDDWNSADIKIMPRLPDFVDTVAVTEHPLVLGVGSGTAQIDMRYSLKRGKGEFKLKSDRKIPKLSVRLGPFGLDVKSVKIESASGMKELKTEKTGTANWAFVRELHDVKEMNFEFQKEV
ncbi:MAG: hypothetical protein WCS27_05405 [Victivallaceae bacterium]